VVGYHALRFLGLFPEKDDLQKKSYTQEVSIIFKNSPMNFIRSTYSPVAQMVAATAIFALVLSNVYGVFPFSNVASATAPGKVTICHATESGDEDTIVYETIVVSENALGAHFENPGTPKSGHEDDLYFEGEVDCPGDEDEEIPGCTDKTAINYDKKATKDDGSCEYEDDECDEVSGLTSNEDEDCDDEDECDEVSALTSNEDDDCEEEEETGYLKVWKHVVGATITDYSVFSYTVNGGASDAFPTVNYEIHEVPVGMYDVVEDAEVGYTTTYAEAGYGDTATPDGDCTDIVVAEGEYSYCRITNTLIVDVCPNILEIQTEIPPGMYKDQAGNCVEIPQCDADANGDWADGYSNADQKKLKNGSDITDTNRTNPAAVTGEEDWDNGGNTGFYSLGFGGSIVVTFDNYVPNVPGNDLTVYEATNGDSYPEESVKVEVSQNGSTWYTLTEEATNGDTSTLVSHGSSTFASLTRLTLRHTMRQQMVLTSTLSLQQRQFVTSQKMNQRSVRLSLRVVSTLM
jgi:hypothetical protein